MPPERLLPDGQPAYMSSWIYVFGVLTIGALVMIIASGTILGLKGPAWWHYTGIGHFFNSIHLWSVELFFFFMVVHLWGKFFMAAWRGGAHRTWMSGAISFLVCGRVPPSPATSRSRTSTRSGSRPRARTGSTRSVSAPSSTSLNFGQMYTYHVLLLPVAVIALVAAHILLVRRSGIVPPLPLPSSASQAAAKKPPAAAAAEAAR